MESEQTSGQNRGSNGDREKLFPEWGQPADNQILYFALALIASVVLIGFLWSQLSDDSPAENLLAEIDTGDPAADLASVANVYDITARYRNGTALLTGEVASNELRAQAAEDARRVSGVDLVDNRLTVADADEPITTTTTEAPLPDPGSLSPDVDAAVAEFAGVNGSASLEVAILEGVVDNQEQFAAAEVRALSVPGIESVDNRLKILQPDVQAALEEAKVQEADAVVTDAVAIVNGFVGNDLEREAALNAAGSVPGISSVQDELVVVEPGVTAALVETGVTDGEASVSTSDDGLIRGVITGQVGSEEAKVAAVQAAAAVSGIEEIVDQLEVVGPSAEDVTEDVNALFELSPIQFSSGSSTILDVSFVTLDQAVEILNQAPAQALFEVQGYTDVAGPEDSNLRLSQNRADAVREYLISQGVSDEKLTAVGYGETEQFAPGTSAEALEANRRVRIEAR